MSTSCKGLVTKYVDCLRQTACYRVRQYDANGMRLAVQPGLSSALACYLCCRSRRKRSQNAQRKSQKHVNHYATPCLRANEDKWMPDPEYRATRATSSCPHAATVRQSNLCCYCTHQQSHDDASWTSCPRPGSTATSACSKTAVLQRRRQQQQREQQHRWFERCVHQASCVTAR